MLGDPRYPGGKMRTREENCLSHHHAGSQEQNLKSVVLAMEPGILQVNLSDPGLSGTIRGLSKIKALSQEGECLTSPPTSCLTSWVAFGEVNF